MNLKTIYNIKISNYLIGGKDMNKKLLGLILLLILLLVNACTHIVDQKKDVLKVHFLNVGQGDSIFIQTPNGYDMLIDGGASTAVLHELGKVMPFWDYTIDAVVATHPHTDHIGGLVDVMEKYTVIQAYSSMDTYYNDAFKEWQYITKLKNIPVEMVNSYRSFTIDDDILVEFMLPQDYSSDPDHEKYAENVNNTSIVVKLTYGDATYLFTGDAEHEVEADLVQQFDVDVDILKVGHHGSKTSSTHEFLREVTPEYAIISAGKNNRYGHPHAQAVDRLRDSGAEIIRTDQDGTITFHSDGGVAYRHEGLDFFKIYAMIKANLEFITN